jgi:hypothetical protein
MGDHKQKHGDERVEYGVREKVPQGIFVSLEFCVDPIEIAPQFLQFGHNILDFEKHRAGHAQVSRTMLARDGLILDGFGTKGAFHLQLSELSAFHDGLDFLMSFAQLIPNDVAFAQEIVALGDQ